MGGTGELVVIGTGSFGDDVLEFDSGNGCTTGIYQSLELNIF